MQRIRGWVPVVLVLVLAACGGWKRAGTDPAPPPAEGFTTLLNQQALFQKLGRLSAGAPLPFTGSVALVKGAGDTVLVLLGLSLENRALSFQKDGSAYLAKYRVDATFQPATGRTVSGGQEESVRVDTFQETGRADESVLFQKFFRLLPGTYQLSVTIRDLQSGTINKAEMPLVVAQFGTATTSAPILTYQVTGRERLSQPLRVVLNPRGAVAFGGDTLLAYLEGYGYPGPASVPFEVRTATDSLVYSDSLRFRGGLPVESQPRPVVPRPQMPPSPAGPWDPAQGGETAPRHQWRGRWPRKPATGKRARFPAGGSRHRYSSSPSRRALPRRVKNQMSSIAPPTERT